MGFCSEHVVNHVCRTSSSFANLACFNVRHLRMPFTFSQWMPKMFLVVSCFMLYYVNKPMLCEVITTLLCSPLWSILLISVLWAISLMFVPCIAWLGITYQHYAPIVIPLFITQAPTYFDTYVPSSGIVFILVIYWKSKIVVSSGCTPVLWMLVCTGCCGFMRYFVQLGAQLDKAHNNFGL
jgi:hypothetical protein